MSFVQDDCLTFRATAFNEGCNAIMTTDVSPLILAKMSSKSVSVDVTMNRRHATVPFHEKTVDGGITIQMYLYRNGR